jgi:hypothetical protein
MRARTGLPARCAGSNCQALAAAAAAEENGSFSSLGMAALTVPSRSIVSVSTTFASPLAPSGYVTLNSESAFGGVLSVAALLREGGGVSSAAHVGALHETTHTKAPSRIKLRLRTIG